MVLSRPQCPASSPARRSSPSPSGCAASRPCRRPPVARGSGRLHRLRHLVPRGADRRRGDPGTRGRARAARRPTFSSSSATRAERRWRSRPCGRSPGRSGSSPARRRARSRRLPTRCSSSRPRSRSPTATRRATRPRSRRSPSCGARTSRRCRPPSSGVLAEEPLPVFRPRPVGRRRRRPRRSDRAGGDPQAARGRAPPSGGPPHRADPPRPPRGDRRDGRVFVLEGEGRAAERARDVVRALSEIGADTTLVPTEHPVVDIVRFQLLTLALAEDRASIPTRSAGTSRAGTPPGSPTADSLSLREEPEPGEGVDDHQRQHRVLADRRLARGLEELDRLVVRQHETRRRARSRARPPARTRSSSARGRRPGLDVRSTEEVPAEAEGVGRERDQVLHSRARRTRSSARRRRRARSGRGCRGRRR